MSSIPAVPMAAPELLTSAQTPPLVAPRPLWSRAGSWLRNLAVDRVGAGATQWARRWLGPRLGVFQQYSPRPLIAPSCRLDVPLLNPPAISIVTPSFNQGRYLERTLRSVLGQGYPALEYIVQDGGSRDESGKILAKYRDRLHHAESVRDRGQAHAINLGFRHASGAIMAYLNSDDLLLPGTLYHVARYFAEHPEVDVVYGNRIVINEYDEEVGRWILPPHCAGTLIWNNYIPQETMFWRRRIWERVGGRFDESLHSALDWELELRYHHAGARFAHLPRFLGAFRIHPQQKTHACHQECGIPEQDRLRQRTHGRPISRPERWLRASPFLLKSMLYHFAEKSGVA